MMDELEKTDNLCSRNPFDRTLKTILIDEMLLYNDYKYDCNSKSIQFNSIQINSD